MLLYTSPLSGCLANNAGDIYDLIISSSFREISTLNTTAGCSLSLRGEIWIVWAWQQLRARPGDNYRNSTEIINPYRYRQLGLNQSPSTTSFLPVTAVTRPFFFWRPEQSQVHPGACWSWSWSWQNKSGVERREDWYSLIIIKFWQSKIHQSTAAGRIIKC